MAGLFSKTPGTEEGKYLVKRRDGSIPQWPHFVMAASDPVTPVALLAYAAEAERIGLDPKYVADIRQLAGEFEGWRRSYGTGDPDAPRHRPDDPLTLQLMRMAKGA